jgi:hypothetical protein
LNHLIEHGAGALEILRDIQRGNVGDRFTIQSTIGEDTHRVWIAYIIKEAKGMGITLKREDSYTTQRREKVEGKVGLWVTGSDFFTELRKHAEVTG